MRPSENHRLWMGMKDINYILMEWVYIILRYDLKMSLYMHHIPTLQAILNPNSKNENVFTLLYF